MFKILSYTLCVWCFSLFLSVLLINKIYYVKTCITGNFFNSPLPERVVKYPYRGLYPTRVEDGHRLEALVPPAPCQVARRLPRLLVVYSYYHDGMDRPHHAENVNFFLAHAVERFAGRDEGKVDYVFVVNNRNHPQVVFPSVCNVWTVYRDDTTDFCAYRAILDSGIIDLREYNYFFFLNPSVVGPILPNYWFESWWKPFVNIFLNQRVKLVGPYLSCLGGTHPFVNSGMFATDAEGLALIKDTWNCSKDPHTIRSTEINQSQRLTEHGFLLSSLMHIYDAVDITVSPTSNFTCNFGKDPISQGLGRHVNETYFAHFIELIFVTRQGGPSKIYDKYIQQAEHKRKHCSDCWKKFNCDSPCKVQF